MKFLEITHTDGTRYLTDVSKSKKKLPFCGEVIEKADHFIYAAWSGYYFIDKKTMQGVYDDGRVSRSKYAILKQLPEWAATAKTPQYTV